jgi:enamine deaminase RidA (YjgF/YER057c/UK114 family)
MAIEKEVYHFIPKLEKRFGYSMAWKVGDTIYVGGTVSIDERGRVVGEGDGAAQVRQIYGIIRKALAHFGADLGNIVEQWFFFSDPEQEEKMLEAIKEEFAGLEYPPAVGFAGNQLALPELLVEVKVTARV